MAWLVLVGVAVWTLLALVVLALVWAQGARQVGRARDWRGENS
jgi:hypothetical protein